MKNVFNFHVVRFVKTIKCNVKNVYWQQLNVLYIYMTFRSRMLPGGIVIEITISFFFWSRYLCRNEFMWNFSDKSSYCVLYLTGRTRGLKRVGNWKKNSKQMIIIASVFKT